MIRVVIGFLTLIVVFSCQSGQKEGKNYSFYHWKTNYQPTEHSIQLLEDGGSDKEYIRFFDLTINTNADRVFPVATVQFEEAVKFSVKEVIPVVYIRNKVFKHNDGIGDNILELARNTAEKIRRIQNTHLTNKIAVREIQIDCDWTDTTRDSYFQFLRELQKQLTGYTITCTLRLHQVKFKERTGVPPVSRVVLMAYNVGDLGNADESNSIINNDVTARYLEHLSDYPLPYDVALPLFQWGVLYRDGQLIGVVKDLKSNVLESVFTPLDNENSFKATRESYINGNFIYPDDVLRMETVDKAELEELSRLIKKSSKSDDEYDTIYYHINSSLTHKFSKDELSQIAQ